MDLLAAADFLIQAKLGVLGTISQDGHPQGAVVGLAADSTISIVFDTAKTSRKYANIEHWTS